MEKELAQKSIDKNIIPPKNIFLLSILEFEFLSEFLKAKPDISLTSILEIVKRNEKSHATAKMMFEDHLRAIDEDLTLKPTRLYQKSDNLFMDVLRRIAAAEGKSLSELGYKSSDGD